MPFPCPVYSHPLWYLEVQASSPTPILLLVAEKGVGLGRRRRALARTPGVLGCGRGRRACVCTGDAVCAALSSVLCSAFICFVPSCRLVLCLSPILPLTPFSGLTCRFSGPCAPPLLPSGCAWVVPPQPVLITALFLIDLSYLGSVVETSLSSAQ